LNFEAKFGLAFVLTDRTGGQVENIYSRLLTFGVWQWRQAANDLTFAQVHSIISVLCVLLPYQAQRAQEKKSHLHVQRPSYGVSVYVLYRKSRSESSWYVLKWDIFTEWVSVQLNLASAAFGIIKACRVLASLNSRLYLRFV